MKYHNWFNLQFFAEGGEGGDGAATGETPAAAGQDYESKLRAKGVPESMIKNRAKKAAPAAKEQPTEQAAAAENPPAPAKESWDDFFARPENKEKMETMMKERVKKYSEAAESFDKSKNFVGLMAKKYNMDPENIDYEKLTEAAFNDDSNFEEQALLEGKPVEEVKQRASNDLRQQMAQAHVQKITRQAEELKSLYPDFDLAKELEDPEFKYLIHPRGGKLSVKRAYESIHSDEVQARQAQVVAETVKQQIANAIRSGSFRPTENGTGAKAASVATVNPRKMTQREREDFKRMIERDYSRGIKHRPGE